MIKLKKNSSSSSLSSSSTANQDAAATSQVAGPMATDFLMECDEPEVLHWQMDSDWVNSGLPSSSGAYSFSSGSLTVIYHC